MKRLAKILICMLVPALVLGLGCTALALTEDDIVGVWESYDYYGWTEFTEDGCWYMYSDIAEYSGLMLDGYYTIEGDTAYLYFPDGTLEDTATLNGSDLTLNDGSALYPSSLPEFEESKLEELDAVGTWSVTDADYNTYWFCFYPAYSYVAYDASGALATGYLSITDDDIILLKADPTDADEDALMAFSVVIHGMGIDSAAEYFYMGSLPFEHASVLDQSAAEILDDLTGGLSDSSFDGEWTYDDYSVYLVIDEAAGTFEMGNDTDTLTGTLEGPDEDGVLTLVTDSESVTVTLSGDTLTDWEGDTLSRVG